MTWSAPALVSCVSSIDLRRQRIQEWRAILEGFKYTWDCKINVHGAQCFFCECWKRYFRYFQKGVLRNYICPWTRFCRFQHGYVSAAISFINIIKYYYFVEGIGFDGRGLVGKRRKRTTVQRGQYRQKLRLRGQGHSAIVVCFTYCNSLFKAILLHLLFVVQNMCCYFYRLFVCFTWLIIVTQKHRGQKQLTHNTYFLKYYRGYSIIIWEQNYVIGVS